MAGPEFTTGVLVGRGGWHEVLDATLPRRVHVDSMEPIGMVPNAGVRGVGVASGLTSYVDLPVLDFNPEHRESIAQDRNDGRTQPIQEGEGLPIEISTVALKVAPIKEKPGTVALNTMIRFVIPGVPPCDKGFTIKQRKRLMWLKPTGAQQEDRGVEPITHHVNEMRVGEKSYLIWRDIPGAEITPENLVAAGMYYLVQVFRTVVIDNCTGLVIARKSWTIVTQFEVLLDGRMGRASSRVTWI